MNCHKTLRLFIVLIPLSGISQYSSFENDDLKLISPTLLNDSIKIQNLNLELIQLDEKKIMIDQLGGHVFKLKGNILERIDNSYQHRMQLGSEIFLQNDTIFRHGGYGFWETRSLLTFYDFDSNEWDVVKTKNIGPEKFGHLSSSNNNELIFYDGLNDLADKIKFYKKNDKLRKKISANGRKKYFTLFNEVKTCKNIIKLSIGERNNFFQ